MGENLDERILPPYANRGVENTGQERLVASVDWLSCTFKVVEDVHEVIRILGLSVADFKTLINGSKGYRKALYFNNIKILFDGNENMGIHVEMSGEGCRTFEKYSNLNWQELFIRFQIHYVAMCSITRLDVAVDDFHGYFKIPDLIKRLKQGSVTSQFRMAKQISNIVIKTGEEVGFTLYFGRPSSDIQVRFYEKNIEQEMKGNIVPESAAIWNRTEIQARDDRAVMLVNYIAAGEIPLGSIITGTLKNYINFRRPYIKNGKKTNDSNRSRWDSAGFWLKFLGDVEKIQLTLRPSEISIEKKYMWIDKSVKKTFAMLALAFPADVDQLVSKFLLDGYGKIEDDDWDIIKDFLKKKMTLDEYLEKTKNAYPSKDTREADK